MSFADHASGIRLLECSKLAVIWKTGDDVTVFRHGVIVNLFDVALFFLDMSNIDLSFMSISSLALELWQFPYISDWPKIWKSEIFPSEFCPKCGEWGKLENQIRQEHF